METKLFYTAQDGKRLDLFNNDYFDLTNVDGLTAINTNVATTTTPQIDGDELQNIQANARPVVLDFQIKSGLDVERAKRAILNVVKIKQTATLTFIQGTGAEQRTIEISGVVQNITMPRFSNAVLMQVSLYCNNPFWQDVENAVVEILRSLPKHHFSIYFPVGSPIPLGAINQSMQQTYINDGDVETGLTITIIATDTVINPRIYNGRGDFIGVNDTMQANDEIVINTYKGQKTITKNGVSIFNKIMSGSVFFNMETGENVFTAAADSGEQYVYYFVTFKRRFI